MQNNQSPPENNRSLESETQHITNQSLMIFGGALVLLLLVGAYVFVADQNGSNTVVGNATTTPMTQVEESENSGAVIGATTSAEAAGGVSTNTESGEARLSGSTGGFALSQAQVEALVSLGVDPASVPETVSSEQEACFVEALGAERVEEIKAGAVPRGMEFLEAESCL